SYTVNNAAVQHLSASETATDSFTVASLDGTAHQLVTVTIQGANDPEIGRASCRESLCDDAVSPAAGTLTVSDVDDGESLFQAEGGIRALTVTGVQTCALPIWSYTVNNAAVQHLSASETATDSFTVASLDGTAHQLVTVTIQGANDP